MPIRLGILSAAHVHTPSYAHCAKRLPNAELVGIWDDDEARGMEFASNHGVKFCATRGELFAEVDAVIITSENLRHADLGVEAAQAGKHILCEKPLVTNEEDGARLLAAVNSSGIKLMTAFPCPYSPAFRRLKQRVDAGDIGPIRGICATNRGSCPFGWFVEPEKSGGGALIDHVVHVADLFRRLLGKNPARVYAQTGNRMYAEAWEDTAMLTLEYSDGTFATLDSSWSRPKSYKTWGDVTMNVVGERGVIELDMFGQQFDVYRNASMRHSVSGYGSDLDLAMVSDFVRSIEEDQPAPITGEDGLMAARVAMAGYRSAKIGQPVAF